MVPSETLSFKGSMYAVRLVQRYFLTRVHSLHSFGQQNLVSWIALLKVGSGKESFFVRHLINTGLDLGSTHKLMINGFARTASRFVGRESFTAMLSVE